MTEDINISKLANLARIDIDDSQSNELADDIVDILDYVESVQEIAEIKDGGPEPGALKNVLREDTNPHEPDAYRESLLAEAPAVDDGFVVVPPILAR